MSSIPASQTKLIESDRKLGESIFEVVIAPLASLKLTVFSFAIGIVVVLVGTLAQVDRDIWEVMELYFKPWLIRIDSAVFFPRSWFPRWTPEYAHRAFALTTLSLSLFAALMTLANADRIKRARWLAATILFAGVLVSLSSIYRGAFWFPGGAAIGAMMCVNLVAAHGLRFKVRAKGKRLAAGLAITAVGLFLTWVVIATGHNSGGFQGEPPFAWTTLWTWIKVGLTVSAVGLMGYALYPNSTSERQKITKWICGGIGICLAVIALWLWVSGNRTYIGASGMRILWQLLLATLAGVVILFGCIPLFGRRAGVVVLHFGVGLLMFGQWYVSNYDVEEQMTMTEGQAVNYGQDIRSVELAIIDRNSSKYPGQDDVFAIPLIRNGRDTAAVTKKEIQSADLPFEIEVVDYFRNSRVELRQDDDGSPADRGRGERFVAKESRGASGAAGSEVNLASGYFKFTKDGKDLGTYLLSQDQLMMRGGRTIDFSTESIQVGDQSYDAQLRFVRNYKDYSVKLIDVRKDDYIGTSIPRNYSSTVHFKDDERDVDRELTIWMNNPRRYAGETFYQSGWQMDSSGNQYTTLQVVRNQGWMIPYVACMVCFVGMVAHFGVVLVRFIARGNEAAEPEQAGWVVPAIVVVLAAIVVVSAARTPKDDPDELNLDRFGQLPLVYQGRVKPFDTLARNSLRVVSDSESFVGVLPAQELAAEWDEIEAELKGRWTELEDVDLSAYQNGDVFGLISLIEEETGDDQFNVTQFVEKQMCSRQPATRWLLDVISGTPRSRRHKVVRIYHPQVRDLLGLPQRKRYRYALTEIAPKMDDFLTEAQLARQQQQADASQLSLYQRKLIEVDRRLRQIILLHRAFVPPELPPLPTPDEFESNPELARSKLMAFREAVVAHNQRLQSEQPPLTVAPTEKDAEWQAYSAAWPVQFLQTQFIGQEANPSFSSLNEILVAYVDGNVSGFNKAVSRYQTQLKDSPAADLKPTASTFNTIVSKRFGSFYQFEVFFNRSAPFLVCAVFYLIAFGLLSLGWLGYRPTLNRAAYWLLVLTFVVHTAALIARIYISGRPPVTNLYSSAVFIGWGAVLLALVIELFFRSGIASVIASFAGFNTLLIAHKLAGDGDTFEVLQAVLDTQFWLATHVVSITLGYATTLLAGLMGAFYILRGVATPSLDRRTGSEFARMIYGTLCFAIVFSFIGTILGGLWADDSWGRFWGWDPKENGALIIVMWNALILHARWGGMIKERGLAVLAVVGNVVTAWSWFGVNELGVGLHSYGFTEGRLLTLAKVVAAHLVIVAIGCLPVAAWWSFRRNTETAAS